MLEILLCTVIIVNILFFIVVTIKFIKEERKISKELECLEKIMQDDNLSVAEKLELLDRM